MGTDLRIDQLFGVAGKDHVQDIFVRSSLLGRIASLDEITGVALLLASDASSYLTGVEIPVDGGSLLAGRQE